MLNETEFMTELFAMWMETDVGAPPCGPNDVASGVLWGRQLCEPVQES